jgi:hypothetical protein
VSKSTAESKHAARDRRAAEMASTHDQPLMTKRKVDDAVGDKLDPSAGRTAQDVEMGEVVEEEAGKGLVGDEWEEVISGGKVLKMRKIEGEQA